METIPKYMWLPANPLVQVWERLLACLLLEIMLYLPVNFAFGASSSGFLFVFNELINLLYLCDCFMQPFVASASQDGKLECRLKTRIRKHLGGDFAVLLVASLPYDALGRLILGHQLEGTPAMISVCLNLLKVYRLRRYYIMSEHREIDRLDSWLYRRPTATAFIRVLKLLVAFGVMAHWYSCAQLYQPPGDGAMDPDNSWINKAGIGNESPSVQYTNAMYFSVTMLTTIGYGDIVPVGEAEKQTFIFMAVAGAVLYAAIFGTVTATVQAYDHANSCLQEQLQMIASFCKVHNLPFEAELKLVRYRTLHWKATQGMHIDTVTKDLPDMLKLDIKMYLYKDDILRVPLFENCHDLFIRLLVPGIRQQVVVEGDFILCQGGAANKLFCLKIGTAAVLQGVNLLDANANESPTVCGMLSSGDIFGEIGILIPGGTRTASVMAESFCQLWTLTKTVLTTALENFPEYHARIVERALERIKAVAALGKLSRHVTNTRKQVQHLKKALTKRQVSEAAFEETQKNKRFFRNNPSRMAGQISLSPVGRMRPLQRISSIAEADPSSDVDDASQKYRIDRIASLSDSQKFSSKTPPAQSVKVHPVHQAPSVITDATALEKQSETSILTRACSEGRVEAFTALTAHGAGKITGRNSKEHKPTSPTGPPIGLASNLRRLSSVYKENRDILCGDFANIRT